MVQNLLITCHAFTYLVGYFEAVPQSHSPLCSFVSTPKYLNNLSKIVPSYFFIVTELGYANDFLAVESMFRGALVVGLSKWFGPRTVLPMALTYMSIHLGKPDLELCSSVIGGYILGVLAYRTQHLWGGIIIHLGIAMLFEILGFTV